jgi:hypothetical protein
MDWERPLPHERLRSRAIHDHDAAGVSVRHLNATSTRIRRFGAVVDGENRLMAGNVGMENARNQRLGA